MTTILITGANGFIGRNLAAHLKPRDDMRLHLYDIGNSETEFRDWVSEADVICHLAGVNRPQNVQDYESGNVGTIEHLCGILRTLGRNPHIIFSSSIQAELDNPYGVSKRLAEEVLLQFAEEGRTPVTIFRLKNVFGKWCRPNYNSVVATFCHNIAHDLPITVSDPDRELELAHVDDVVAAFITEMDLPQLREPRIIPPDQIPSQSITLADLAGRIQFFHEMRQSLCVPDCSLRFNRQLYATYLSYIEPSQAEYGLDVKRDARGNLVEFIKSPWFGIIIIMSNARSFLCWPAKRSFACVP
jgi:UDP-2-acetamido-2,6-beta-L-arabino-hexul-4-ose reductase